MSEAPHVPTRPAPLGTNGFGVAALTLGIVALLGAAIPDVNWFTGLLAIVGLILGIVGLTRKRTGKGTAVAGIIISGIALLVTIAVFFFTPICCAFPPAEEDPIAIAPTPIASDQSQRTS